MSNVSYDSRAVTIDGKRTLILSGSVHYPRSTPAMWPEIFRRSRDAGLNTIETYVFWNLHERERGVFDFSGRLDLRRFCELAQEHGFHVILRIGPYICSETNYGGFPAWLRDVPGMRMRTYNQPFMREMERWVRTLCDHLRGLFAPEGGPIILAQIENEYGMLQKQYGRDGRRYAKWAIDRSLSLDLGIPWIMCVGGAPGAIETINGFYAHREIGRHFRAHPDQPALWTEDWPGWYGVWGAAHRVRGAEDVAYGVARFVAAGGTGVNYYMWHGGTNFGRETMYLQTTSYDFDAPLDEFGLATTKSEHLARLHAVLAENADVLLKSGRPKPQKLGGDAWAFAYGRGAHSIVFLCNDGVTGAASVSWRGKTYLLPGKSVTILVNGREVMNTSQVLPSTVVRRRWAATRVNLARFVTWPEPVPAQRPKDMPGRTVAGKPVEQLLLTKDRSDYCWYTTMLTVRRGGTRGELKLKGVGDLVYVYVDRRLRASTPLPLVEQRGAITGAGFTQRFTLELAPGRHELSILSCALGLIKGDWQIDANMAEERKGLWGQAYWRGRRLAGAWTMDAGLVGEGAQVFAGGAGAVAWRRTTKTDARRPLRWHLTTFKRPRTRVPLALDLTGMNKGLAWLNGRCIGRYWLVAGTGGTHAWQGDTVQTVRVGEPTQRYYHLPVDWLGDENTLVLFEELGGDPTKIHICERR